MNEGETEKRLEDIESALEELADLNLTVPIIVEGKKDVSALRSLGLKGELIVVNTGKTIMNTCEELGRKYKEVVILTDWDRKGGALARLLKKSLESCGVRPDMAARAKLARLCKKEIKDVESLFHYISTLERKKYKQ